MTVLTFFKKLLQILTILLRYLWLFFPACLFLYAGYACFWSLSQGKDLLIASLETPGSVTVLWIAVVFWVLTTWYSSRILVYKRESLYHCGPEFFPTDEGVRKTPPVAPLGFLNRRLFYAPTWLGLHLPRLLGYLCFSVILLAYWQLPVFAHPLSSAVAICLLLVVSVGLYIFLSKALERIWVKRSNDPLPAEKKKALEISFQVALVLFVLLLFVQYFIAKSFPANPAKAVDADYQHQAVWIMILLFIIQQIYLYVVVNRKHFRNEPVVEETKNKWRQAFRAMLHFVRVDDKGERTFFLVFNIISVIAIVLYLTGVFNIRFAVLIGSAGFALLAFGILVGYFALVSIFSIHFRINFHILFLLLVFVLGNFREPHYARLLTKDTTGTTAQRPDLKTYFLNWALAHRDSILAKKDSNYPVFFVLADGGASRSGYWVASVLGKLHDESSGDFSNHLFCLSGASGGSVGNATYFNLLKNLKGSGKRFKTEGQEFLGHDFLSYTLARMLGPDFFRPILPIDLKNLDDRAGALEQVMEDGVGTVSLAGKFKTPFSAFIPDTINRLPIICINTTRMQDGRPGVISNIRLEESIFGKRIDVIGLLKPENDLRLSTAMVMGARFPYVSPAGRIDEHRTEKSDPSADSIASHYFVDGGYFDNSGAGVVHEMLIGLREITNQLKSDSTFSFLHKLQYYVIHITNSPVGGVENISAVQPIVNDLFAPVTTLVGSYGTQTDVNDSRLEKYQQLTYDTSKVPHYRDANLYYGLDTNKISFPMSWAISDYYRTRMNRQVDSSKQIIELVRDVNRLMQNK